MQPKMTSRVDLDEEDVLLKQVLLSALSEERLQKKYFCGYDDCQSREYFHTWKHIQQHYKNYHKVIVKKKDVWDDSIPKIKEIDANQAEREAENMTDKKLLKRKRSVRTDSSLKAQKNKKTGSTGTTNFEPLFNDSNNKFSMLLSNATVLAKVTKDFSALKNQIRDAVITDDLDPNVLLCVNEKMKNFNENKESLEKTIEIVKSGQEFSPAQKCQLEEIKKLTGKELTMTIEFAKTYLATLQMHEIGINPEYIALSALQNVLENN